MHPFDFRVLAFERHGFIAKETVSFVEKFARMKANFFELDPSEETRKWYTVRSCCIQRANARVLSGDPTPGRRNPPPRSLLANGRGFHAGLSRARRRRAFVFQQGASSLRRPLRLLHFLLHYLIFLHA